MGLSKLDQSLASNYASAILAPLKYGENGVFFWFPGSGMTTIIQDIFSDKEILRNNLLGLTSRLNIFQFWGHLAETKTAEGLIKEAGFADYLDLKKLCDDTLRQGKEVVCLVGRIDSFPEKERMRVLKLFVRLCTINHRRIHILLNLTDKPWFEQALGRYPELVILANRMEIMPVINGNLLAKYIKTRVKEYGSPLSINDLDKVAVTYGGILQLTKEYLRSKGNISTLELKLSYIWNCLPKSYQDELDRLVIFGVPKFKSRVFLDLIDFGITGLKVFKVHHRVFNQHPEQVLPHLLTPGELSFWQFCVGHSGELLDRELVIKMLRPENGEDISLWAIDQAVSRFRKKLAEAGTDPELLKTIKKKGYIWSN